MPSLKPAVLFLVLSILPAAIFAGPPYQTDDPEPPDPGRWELLLAVSAVSEADGGTTVAAPQLEVNFGAAKDLQISVSPQMTGFSEFGNARYGFGDLELGAKYRFLQESEKCPQAAFYPQVVLPTGSHSQGLGSGRTQTFLPLWLQKSWGPWCSFGGGGYWFNPGNENKNWVFAGAALQRDFGEAISIGAELFFHSAAQTDDKNGLGSNLALLWRLTAGNNLVFSAGRDIGFGNTAFTCYMAYQKGL